MRHLSELQKQYAGPLAAIGVSAREARHEQNAPDKAFVKKVIEKKDDAMTYTTQLKRQQLVSICNR